MHHTNIHKEPHANALLQKSERFGACELTVRDIGLWSNAATRTALLYASAFEIIEAQVRQTRSRNIGAHTWFSVTLCGGSISYYITIKWMSFNGNFLVRSELIQ